MPIITREDMADTALLSITVNRYSKLLGLTLKWL